MKTLILALGLWLTSAATFGIGHPHNLFATRHRLLVRPQPSLRPVLPARPTLKAESARPTRPDWRSAFAEALRRSCHRLISPLLFAGPVQGVLVGSVLLLAGSH